MRKKPIIYLDGKYIKVTAQMLESFTPGIFKAQGVFETMLALGGRVFDVAVHLKRLKGAFKNAKISPLIIHEVAKLNGFDTSRVRVIAWRENDKEHIAVMALKHKMPERKEYKVCLIKTRRQATSRLANTKSLDYGIFAKAYHKAISKGFDEALLINNKGYIFEASRANVFWFKKGRLHTPPLSSGCLKGITRSKIIEHAHQLKIPFQEKNLSIEELKKADKVFITNSLIGIKHIKNPFPSLPR